VIQKLIDQKAGFVCLHYAVNIAARGDRVIDWMGGYYDRASPSPALGRGFQEAAGQPDRRGVQPFKIRDE